MALKDINTQRQTHTDSHREKERENKHSPTSFKPLLYSLFGSTAVHSNINLLVLLVAAIAPAIHHSLFFYTATALLYLHLYLFFLLFFPTLYIHSKNSTKHFVTSFEPTISLLSWPFIETLISTWYIIWFSYPLFSFTLVWMSEMQRCRYINVWRMLTGEMLKSGKERVFIFRLILTLTKVNIAPLCPVA